MMMKKTTTFQIWLWLLCPTVQVHSRQASRPFSIRGRRNLVGWDDEAITVTGATRNNIDINAKNKRILNSDPGSFSFDVNEGDIEVQITSTFRSNGTLASSETPHNNNGNNDEQQQEEHEWIIMTLDLVYNGYQGPATKDGMEINTQIVDYDTCQTKIQDNPVSTSNTKFSILPQEEILKIGLEVDFDLANSVDRPDLLMFYPSPVELLQSYQLQTSIPPAAPASYSRVNDVAEAAEAAESSTNGGNSNVSKRGPIMVFCAFSKMYYHGVIVNKFHTKVRLFLETPGEENGEAKMVPVPITDDDGNDTSGNGGAGATTLTIIDLPFDDDNGDEGGNDHDNGDNTVEEEESIIQPADYQDNNDNPNQNQGTGASSSTEDTEEVTSPPDESDQDNNSNNNNDWLSSGGNEVSALTSPPENNQDKDKDSHNNADASSSSSGSSETNAPPDNYDALDVGEVEEAEDSFLPKLFAAVAALAVVFAIVYLLLLVSKKSSKDDKDMLNEFVGQPEAVEAARQTPSAAAARNSNNKSQAPKRRQQPQPQQDPMGDGSAASYCIDPDTLELPPVVENLANLPLGIPHEVGPGNRRGGGWGGGMDDNTTVVSGITAYMDMTSTNTKTTSSIDRQWNRQSSPMPMLFSTDHQKVGPLPSSHASGGGNNSLLCGNSVVSEYNDHDDYDGVSIPSRIGIVGGGGGSSAPGSVVVAPATNNNVNNNNNNQIGDTPPKNNTSSSAAQSATPPRVQMLETDSGEFLCTDAVSVASYESEHSV